MRSLLRKSTAWLEGNPAAAAAADATEAAGAMVRIQGNPNNSFGINFIGKPRNETFIQHRS
jgi:hypothetical protein